MPGLLKFVELKMIPNCAKRDGQLWPIRQELPFHGWFPTAKQRVGGKTTFGNFGNTFKWMFMADAEICLVRVVISGYRNQNVTNCWARNTNSTSPSRTHCVKTMVIHFGI